MEYFHENIRYLNLPKVPEELISEFVDKSNLYPEMNKEYKWTDEHNSRINQWCQENICDNAYFGFQVIKNNLAPHKDSVVTHLGPSPLQTSSKLIYLISQGGENVMTQFWLDDKKTMIKEYKIETNRWHLLQVDAVHSVEGVDPGQTRWAIVAQMLHRFPYERENYSDLYSSRT